MNSTNQQIPVIDEVALRVGVGRGIGKEQLDRAYDFLKDAPPNASYIEHRGCNFLWETLDKDGWAPIVRDIAYEWLAVCHESRDSTIPV